MLMKKGPKQMPDILTAKYLPVDRSHDPISEEEISFVTPEPGTPISNIALDETPSTEPSITTSSHKRQTVSPTITSKVYNCFPCMFCSGKAVNENVDGPTDKQTVMYGTTATYLGIVTNPARLPYSRLD